MNGQTSQRSQQGSMLLEALISILIFSIGILAIVGLQASSITLSTDAKYRSDANLIANQYIAQMWADVAAAVTAKTVAGVPIPFNQAEFAPYTTGGARFTTWHDTYLSTLPNATAVVTANTVITCGTFPCPAAPFSVQQNTITDVSISISWQLPGGEKHTYSTTALISAQKQL